MESPQKLRPIEPVQGRVPHHPFHQEVRIERRINLLEIEDPAGPQHTSYLPDTASPIEHMVNDAVVYHRIEPGITEWKVLSVPDKETDVVSQASR